MSVRQKILAACLGFLLIIALLGLQARQQLQQMSRLSMEIYDHSLIGITYVNQAEAQFLRLFADQEPAAPAWTPARRAGLQAVLDKLDVAVERAGSSHTRDAARHVQSMVAALPDAPPAALALRKAEVDRAIARLVRSYDSEGLRTRDRADEVVQSSGRNLLGQVALALAVALGLTVFLGRNLSIPLIDLVRSIGLLTAGDLEHEIAARLSSRRDEIGAVARATAIFRAAMCQNVAAGEERARLQAENEAARKEAERSLAAIAAKSDFLATTSHEIRTPMNGVATIADLLADTELGAEQLKMVNIIRQSAKWLIRVINDILDFSKLEAQQLHLETVAFMLDEVIETSCEILAAKADEKGLSLTIEGRDMPGLCRIGDPLRLRQILLNLLGNAIKFTASGGVTLALRPQPGSISVSVADTGIGIPPDKIGDLFQPYNQLRSDTARAYGGTGLGLSITRNLVGLMGGELDVASEPGRGSCFTVRLDLPSDVASLCKSANRPAWSDQRWRPPDPAVSAANAAVVLCAEDNAINRDVLARVLLRLGFNSEMAKDGVAALALLDRRRHGVLLTDAQMPGLDGWELAGAIRRDEAQRGLARLPIVMLTANALSETDNRIASVGIDAVLTKPLDMGALEETLLGAVGALATLRIAAASDANTASPVRPTPLLAPPHVPQTRIDLDVLADLVGDDPEILSDMMDEFRASVMVQHDQLRSAVASGEIVAVARHAHAMKGAARYAGAKTLAASCHDIETRANGGSSIETLAEDLAKLDAIVARLPQDIAAALSGLKATECVAGKAVLF